MGNLTHTVSGDIASFRSAARVPIESLKCYFKPKQDLHGYDKPWPGGGGKNLFNIDSPIEYGAYNSSTGIFTTGKNRIITDYIPINYNITYTMKVNSNTDNLAFINYNLFDENKTWIGSRDTNNDISFNGELTHTFIINLSTAKYIRIVLRDATDASTFINERTLQNSKLQIEIGSTATSYEPYENICPIEGWNKLNYHYTGKSLVEFYTDKFEYNGNHYNGYDYRWSSPWLIPDRTIKYTYSVYIDNTNSNTNACAKIWFRNKDNSAYVDGTAVAGTNIAAGMKGWSTCVLNLSSKSNTYYVAFGLDIYAGAIAYTPMVEIGNTRTDYEPYHKTIIPITFPILGKNKFNWDVEFVNPDITATTSTSKRIFQPYTYCVGGSYSNYFMPIAVESYSIENGIISVKRKTGYSVYGVSYALPLIGGQTYYLSCTAVSGFIHTAFYDEEGSYLTGSSNNYSNFSFTVPNNATIGVFNFIPSNTTDTATFSNIQIELGDTATEYTEFSNNNTVYDGYVDITKGEVVATHILLENLWSEWTLHGVQENTTRKYFNLNQTIYNSSQWQNVARMSNIAPYAYEWTEMDAPHFYASSSTRIYMWLPIGTDESTKIQVVGALLSPIHYPLSKTELKTFLDQNNIWSDTNDITEVSYQIHDSNMIKETKAAMLAANNNHYKKVIWNNMANGTINSTDWKVYSTDNVSATFTDGIANCEVINTSKVRYSAGIVTNYYPSVLQTNKYYGSYMINPEYQGLFGMEYAGGIQQYASQCEPNIWTFISFSNQPREDRTGAMYIPFPASYPENTTPKFQIKSPLYINLTQMFGLGNEPTKAEFEALCALNNIDLTAPHPKDIGTEMYWIFP